MVNVIATGSTGNAVLLFDSILIDVGVSYKKIEPYINQLQLMTWSHKHSDHFNLATIKKIVFERPSLRIAVCEHEYERAIQTGCKNIDVLELNKWYDYGLFKISTFKTYHDVLSNGYRIFKDEYKIFFATDTAHLKGITAPNYTHYLCESNYDEDTIDSDIARIEASGGFAYQKGAKNTHLSWQQHKDFIFENAAKDSKVIRLHESQTK